MWQVYKYQPVNKYVLSNLAKGKLWFACPEAFNDPFEFRLQRSDQAKGIATLREQNLHLEGLSDDELIQRATATYEGAMRSMGVCCFTEVPDDVLMWSYYADAHRGICLGFGGNDGEAPEDAALYPVRYEEEYPQLDFEDVWHVEGLAKVLWTKERAWSHEREWRVLKVEGNIHGDYPGVLNRVIFGLRTPDDDQELVRSLVLGEDHVEFFQVRRDEARYQLHIEPL